MRNRWSLRLISMLVPLLLVAAGCGSDDGAGVRTIEDAGSGSGSASGSGSGSGSGSHSGSGSGSGS